MNKKLLKQAYSDLLLPNSLYNIEILRDYSQSFATIYFFLTDLKQTYYKPETLDLILLFLEEQKLIEADYFPIEESLWGHALVYRLILNDNSPIKPEDFKSFLDTVAEKEIKKEIISKIIEVFSQYPNLSFINLEEKLREKIEIESATLTLYLIELTHSKVLQRTLSQDNGKSLDFYSYPPGLPRP